MFNFIKKHKLLFASVLLISVIVSASIVLIAFILQEVVDSALQQNWTHFQAITIKTLIFLVVFGIIHYSYGLVNAKFLQKVTIAMRQFIVNGLVNKNLDSYNKQNSSYYLSTLTNDIKQVEDNYLKPLVNIIQNGVMFVLSLAALFYLNTYVTLALLACVVLMFIGPSLLAKVLETKQNAVSKRMASFTSHIKDFLDGFDVLYSYRVLGKANKHFQEENEKTAKTRYEADHVNAINNSLSNLLGLIAQFAVILISGYLIIKGELTGGGLIALVQLSGSIVSPVVTIFSEAPKMKSVKSIVERILEIGQFGGEEKQEIQTLASHELQPKEINLKQVQFSYGGEQQKQALKDINLNIKTGKKYAIIGESGCGKSTLVKLIAGHFVPTEGQLLLDGTIVDNQKLTRLIAMVSQNVFLFDDTVKHNIALYEQFSDDKWAYAITHSGTNKFIDQIDNGLEGLVGEGGSSLSGGQRQRISIARALIRNKPIVILDEGTSALDMQTSHEVESNLLNNDRLTLLTITHQINENLLKKYDQIIYMEAGKIVECGTYDELMARGSQFKQFTTINPEEKKEVVAVI